MARRVGRSYSVRCETEPVNCCACGSPGRGVSPLSETLQPHLYPTPAHDPPIPEGSL